jgi:hypothetical protein
MTEQAQRASEDLCDFLTATSNEIVPVMPVAVLPGWKELMQRNSFEITRKLEKIKQ